jgi:integrase/recombinase XerD
VVHTLYSTGARASEIITLTRDQVRHGQAQEALISGKGGRQRTIFFTPQAQAALRAYLEARGDDNPWLFIGHNGRRPGHIHRGTVWTIVKDAVEALELDPSTSPHTLRHYRATQLLNAGMPLESVQDFLGHQNIGTTRTVYAHTATRTLRDQVRQFGRTPQEALEDRGRPA